MERSTRAGVVVGTFLLVYSITFYFIVPRLKNRLPSKNPTPLEEVIRESIVRLTSRFSLSSAGRYGTRNSTADDIGSTSKTSPMHRDGQQRASSASDKQSLGREISAGTYNMVPFRNSRAGSSTDLRDPLVSTIRLVNNTGHIDSMPYSAPNTKHNAIVGNSNSSGSSVYSMQSSNSNNTGMISSPTGESGGYADSSVISSATTLPLGSRFPALPRTSTIYSASDASVFTINSSSSSVANGEETPQLSPEEINRNDAMFCFSYLMVYGATLGSLIHGKI